MPIEHKTVLYGCKFNCGRNRTKYLDKMIKHENECLYNPENRSCRICRHFRFFYAGPIEDLYPDEGGVNQYLDLKQCIMDCAIKALPNGGPYLYTVNGESEFVEVKIGCDKWEYKGDE